MSGDDMTTYKADSGGFAAAVATGREGQRKRRSGRDSGNTDYDAQKQKRADRGKGSTLCAS
jgi:hypothetical protein